MVVLMLGDDGGQVEGECAVHVGEGSCHLSDVLEYDMVSVSRRRKQGEGPEQQCDKGERWQGR